MSVLQHYYTSFVNKETGSAGFQVKAMSPEISSEVQSTISRLIAYRIPPTLNEHPISDHPIALRYYYEGSDRCILLCSQSNGTDENGRPGNFFAHTVVMDPDLFKRVPPILFWRSPFWRTRDTGNSASIAPLPTFDVDPVLDIENVWSFLAQGKRRAYFHKLMSAVVHCNTSRRRIVIIDSADNVAMWIAAVSCMLPLDYRPMLSFATYHHDPYQAQFMITGTTTDSSFRASSDEYMSFFILNTEADRISDVEDSLYADEAAESAKSIDEYETRLLSLFTEYVQRFPPPTRIDEQLDGIVRYASILKQSKSHLTPEDLETIRIALSTLEATDSFSSEDLKAGLKELNDLNLILRVAYQTQPQDGQAIRTEYNRVIALQKQHGISTDEAMLNELKHFTLRLIRSVEPEQVFPHLDNLRLTYGEEIFLTTIYGKAYLDWLNQFAQQVNIEQLTILWKYLGPYIRFGKYSKDILFMSLCKLGELWIAKRYKMANPLFEAVTEANEGYEQELLRFAVAKYSLLPDGTLERFYLMFVYKVDMDKRVPYRAIVKSVCEDIDVSELCYQIKKAGLQHGLVAFERWIEHAKRQGIEYISSLIDEGLNCLYQLYVNSDQEWYNLAPKILTSKALEPLPAHWEDHLVETALSRVSLSRFSPTDIKLCEKYQNRPGLPEETRMVIGGLLAMSSGNLEPTLAESLGRRFDALTSNQYQEEARSFISEFLHTCATFEAHNLMVDMIFTWEKGRSFWEPYWETFIEIVSKASTAEQAVDLLSFWFAASPEIFHMPYTVQFFLLNLPQNLGEARNFRTFQEAALMINARAEKQKLIWYPLVRDYFSGRRKIFASVGQNLATQLRRHLINQNVDEKEARARAEQEQKEREFAASIAAIFEDKKVRQSHAQRILKVYDWQQREQFWTCYWQYFTDFLISRDADKTLELLSFWFDASFQTLKHMPHIPQEFFLGLSEVLEAARKERGFREKVREISLRGNKYNLESYQWYGLVHEYFTEQEKGRFSFMKR